MDDLIIGCSTNYTWDTLKYWVNSINKSGFKGKKILILMNANLETAKKVLEAGFEIIGFGQDESGNLVYKHERIPVHVERFLHIYDYLSKNEFRYVITTDVKDVIFQKNPIDWLENNLRDGENFVASSESILYKDEPWGNRNLLDTFGPYIYDKFKDNEIYNVGVLAGRGFAIRDLAMNIFSSCLNKPIPICDQSTYNFLISQSPYLQTTKYLKSEDGFACQLGTTADPSKIESFRPFLLEAEPKMENGMVTTSKGEEYSIVHQYDRVPYWKSVLEVKYG